LIIQIKFLQSNKIMKNKNIQNKFSIFGINNSLSVLLSDKVEITAIFLLKDGLAIKNKNIKNNINNFKKASIILDKFEFNKKFNSIRSQGIVIDFKFNLNYELPQFSNKNTCLLMPERIEDPQNLGQIIRTSECAGIDGILVSNHRTVSITNSVLQVSQGAFLNMPIYMIGNINQTLETLKKEGFWVIGVENGVKASEWYDIDLSGKIILVFGSEGRGIRQSTLKKCDFIATISMLGKINSLNISASVSAILFERIRQLNKG